MQSKLIVEIGMLPTGAAYAKPFGFAFPVVEIAREIPGLRWDAGKRCYVGFPDAVEVFAKALDEACLAVIQGQIESPSLEIKIDGTLRSYQKEGVEFVAANSIAGGAVLAFDMGLGKTRTAIHSFASLVKGKLIPRTAVVVCPAVIKAVWFDEFKKLGLDYQVTLLEGTKNPRALVPHAKKPSIFLLNYDIAHAWLGPIVQLKPGMVIFDEAHALMSPRSRRSSACRAIAEGSLARVALTGTPMTARPRDLWNVIDTISPGRFGKPFQYYKRYCDAHQETVGKDTVIWKTDGASNVEELAGRLRWIMLRKSKSEAAIDLPPRIRQTIDVDVAWRWRRTSILDEDTRAGKGALRRALDLAGEGKVDAGVDLALDSLATNHSVVIFSHLKSTATRVAQALAKKGQIVECLTGDVSASKRAEAIKKFAIMNGARALSVTIDAVKEGVDCSFADVAIFIDLDWIPSKILQAESRLHRFGQKQIVNIYFLIAKGTVDEHVKSRVIDRLDLFEKLIGGAQEASDLKHDLTRLETASEEEILSDLRAAVLAGNVLPENEEDDL